MVNYVTVLLVALAAVHLAAGVGNDEVCSTDSDCTVTNQECLGEDHFTSGTCNKGTCACSDAYAWHNPKCKTKKYNGEACVDADDKCVTGTCASGTCSCGAGTTYNTNLQNCLTDGKKLLGETCSTTSDCYGTVSTVKCDTTCQCETGYVVSNYMCRAPHVGEACISTTASPAGVACASQLSADSSLATETCVSGTCTCPSDTSTRRSVTFRGTTYDMCLVNYSGTRRSDGASCANHTSCASYYCGTCPGDNAKTCLRASSASRLPCSAVIGSLMGALFLKLM